MTNKPTYLNPLKKHTKAALLKKVIATTKESFPKTIKADYLELFTNSKTTLEEERMFDINLPFYFLNNIEELRNLYISSDYKIYPSWEELKNNTVKKQTLSKTSALLLGSKDKEKFWLTPPSFDCLWSWDFGYVGNRNCHMHIDNPFVGKIDYYNHESNTWEQTDYIHNLYDSPALDNTTFSSSEGWQLSDLFKQFYLLQKMAEFAHREKPGCHITTSPVNHGSLKSLYKKLNTIMIPKVILKILEILSPSKKDYEEQKRKFDRQLEKAQRAAKNLLSKENNKK